MRRTWEGKEAKVVDEPEDQSQIKKIRAREEVANDAMEFGDLF